jgi:hypothetical protein
VRAVRIAYNGDEERIAAAIGRLDELGDLIDGEITSEEVDTLVASLSNAPEQGS